MHSEPENPAKPVAGHSRIAVLDVARGTALLAMAVYHLAWDLEFFGYAAPGLTAVGGWKMFARCIASSFLFLVGVSLVLAHGGGIRWRSFWRRWAMIAAAALLITVATRLATPESFIFFGILHQIALASLLGLAFLRVPWALNLAIAAVVVAVPFWFSAAVFDRPALWWLGLAPVNPRSNDYVPLFPWFGAVLAGIAAAQVAIRLRLDRRLAALTVRPPLTGLAVLGRHGLAFYLLHQPVLIACVWLLAQVAPPATVPPETRFVQSCRTSCAPSRDAEFCASYCACMLEELAAAGQLPKLFAGAPDEELSRQIGDTASYCVAATEAKTPEEQTP